MPAGTSEARSGLARHAFAGCCGWPPPPQDACGRRHSIECWFAQKPSPVRFPLYSDVSLLVERRRELLCETHQKAHQARRVSLPPRSQRCHPPLPRRHQCKTKALFLDQGPQQNNRRRRAAHLRAERVARAADGDVRTAARDQPVATWRFCWFAACFGAPSHRVPRRLGGS